MYIFIAVKLGIPTWQIYVSIYLLYVIGFFSQYIKLSIISCFTIKHYWVCTSAMKKLNFAIEYFLCFNKLIFLFINADIILAMSFMENVYWTMSFWCPKNKYLKKNGYIFIKHLKALAKVVSFKHFMARWLYEEIQVITLWIYIIAVSISEI